MKREEVADRLYRMVSYRIEYDTLNAMRCDRDSVEIEAIVGEYFADVKLNILYRDIGQGKAHHEIPYVEVNEVVVTTSDAYHSDISYYIYSKLDYDIECINKKLTKNALQIA